MESRRPTSPNVPDAGVRERPGPCLGDLRELRAWRLRQMLKAQGIELSASTEVIVQSPAGEQKLTLVPDVARNLGPRWLVRCPNCGVARLKLYWGTAGRRFACRKCLHMRSARDRFRKNRLIAPLLRLLADELDGGRRGGAGGRRHDADGDAGDTLVAEVGAMLRGVSLGSGVEGSHGGSAECPDEQGEEGERA